MTVELDERAEDTVPKQLMASDVPPSQPAPVVPQHRLVIEPASGWQVIDLRELWRYRELLFFLCWRDIMVRYKQTVLGAAWAILQPAMMMVVFTIFFSKMGKMSSGETPYPLFVLAGLLPWFFFSNAVVNASNSVVGSERLITKIYFPRLTVPFASVGAAVIDFLVAISLMFVMMLAYGFAPSWNIFLAPVIFAVIVLTAAGLGTMLAALNVTYRDFRYVIPFMIQIGLFATPSVYMQPTGNESATFQWMLIANPMTSLIAGFRACLLGGAIPWFGLGVALLLTIVVFLFGCFYFRKVEDHFADII